MITIDMADVEGANLADLAAMYSAVRSTDATTEDSGRTVWANVSARSFADDAIRQVVAHKGPLSDDDASARWFRAYLTSRYAIVLAFC